WKLRLLLRRELQVFEDDTVEIPGEILCFSGQAKRLVPQREQHHAATLFLAYLAVDPRAGYAGYVLGPDSGNFYLASFAGALEPFQRARVVLFYDFEV